jgi:hypothetical protein
MRGWPSIELVGLGIALALLVLPLHAFTLGRRPPGAAAPASIPAPAPERTEARLAARFVHPPLRFRVACGPETLWDASPPPPSGTFILCHLPPIDGNIDLRVEVEWPDGTPETVLELTLEPDGWETRSKTLWGRGNVSSLLTYVWP